MLKFIDLMKEQNNQFVGSEDVVNSVEPEVLKGSIPIITDFDDMDTIPANIENLPKSNQYVVDLGDGSVPFASEQLQKNLNTFVESNPKEFIDTISANIENLPKSNQYVVDLDEDSASFASEQLQKNFETFLDK